MQYILNGLDCANCAAKIERAANKLDCVKSVTVDFAAGRMLVEPSGQVAEDDIFKQLEKLVHDFEPDVELKKLARGTKASVRKQEGCCCEGHDHEHNHDTHNCEEEHGHSHDDAGAPKAIVVSIAASAALLIIANVVEMNASLQLVIFLAAYFVAGYDVLYRSFRNILKGEIFDENFLMSIATIGALAIGQSTEAVGVMLFYKVGEFFQSIAVNRSRKSISSLMDIRPDYANLKNGGGYMKVAPEEVEIGDIIQVRPGEKIPLDGNVTDGFSSVDSSALTGESVPVDVCKGDSVLSGAINKTGVLTIEVTKNYGDSTVSKILDLVQNASSKKAKTENFITKFARIYTPAVVALAALVAIVPPLVLEGATFSEWLYKALVFLVISCPCALVISIPLGFFGGIGGASAKGILIKGSNYLEALNHVDTVVFDKTGTLTKGVFKVTQIAHSNHFSEGELLKYAALAESFSSHPIAVSIMKAYGGEIDKTKVLNYSEVSGKGIKAEIDGKTVLAGNIKLMESENVVFTKTDIAGTAVHVAVDGGYAGYILISDVIKDDAKQAIAELKKAGVANMVMLTGDNKAIAEKIAAEIGIDKCYSELLPQDKVQILEDIENNKPKGSHVIFVGDGINDAPVLARADIGIAMGGVGSDAAIEAADIVIMNDEPSKIATAIKIAKKTRRIVVQNITFAMVVKIGAMILGLLGMAAMWEAVIADVGVTVVAILNSMRALNLKDIDKK